MAYLKGRCTTLVRYVVVFDSTSRGLRAGLALIAISLSAAASAFQDVDKEFRCYDDGQTVAGANQLFGHVENIRKGGELHPFR